MELKEACQITQLTNILIHLNPSQTIMNINYIIDKGLHDSISMHVCVHELQNLMQSIILCLILPDKKIGISFKTLCIFSALFKSTNNFYILMKGRTTFFLVRDKKYIKDCIKFHNFAQNLGPMGRGSGIGSYMLLFSNRCYI